MTTDTKPAATEDLIMPAAQGLELAKANTRRELERMDKLRKREKLTLTILMSVSVLVAAGWTYLNHITERAVDASGKALIAKVSKSHPDFASKVEKNISCGVTLQKGQMGPLQYMKMTPNAMSEAVSTQALACAKKDGEQALVDMRVALFQPSVH